MSAHIFVVEDEKPIQTLLRYNLEKEGFKVSSSENGEEALSLIKENKPDLILLLDVTRSFRNKNLPVS